MWTDQWAVRMLKRVGERSFIRAKNRDNGPMFAWVSVTSMFKQRLGDMSQRDVEAEGYTAFEQLMQLSCFNGCTADTVVWVLKFHVVQGRPLE